jgi:hypothetical protein
MNLVGFHPQHSPVSRAGSTQESENYHVIMAMSGRLAWRGCILTGKILHDIGILFLPGPRFMLAHHSSAQFSF